MKIISKYFADWGFARWLRLSLSVVLLIAYFQDRQEMYLLVGLFLGAQAVFNISCPGGACTTTPKSTTKQVMEIKKYEPKEQ